VVLADHEVVDVDRFHDGFRVTVDRPGAWTRRHRQVFAADQVVFAAGALGTTRLLLRLRAAGRLAGVSDRLGHTVRTNSESIIGALAGSTEIDYSRGVSITSSIHTRSDTHIEAVRYGKGSNAMGLLGTIMVDGGGSVPRQGRFMRRALAHPIQFLRSLSVRHWAERALILLVMQSVDNRIRLELRGRRVVSHHDQATRPPTYISDGNRAARLAAARMGGAPSSALNEVLLDTPTTAHLLGGACVGASPAEGVVDPYHRMFGEPGLHIVDGAAVGANLGVNPALTITAMAERAMSLWPNRGESDPRPRLGEAYHPVDAVPPVKPIAGWSSQRT
jgi:cholesterol oxidase